jgi:hypothetical protein
MENFPFDHVDWLAARPRFHLHFTPIGASWLGLVERWFALLAEKQIKRGTHRRMRAPDEDTVTGLLPQGWQESTAAAVSQHGRACRSRP